MSRRISTYDPRQPLDTDSKEDSFCAGFGLMPITMVAVQLWAFCALTGRARPLVTSWG
jgi:hypothetical protein